MRKSAHTPDPADALAAAVEALERAASGARALGARCPCCGGRLEATDDGIVCERLDWGAYREADPMNGASIVRQVFYRGDGSIDRLEPPLPAGGRGRRRPPR